MGYDRVKIIENEKNLGAGLSRNKGIEISKGKFKALPVLMPPRWLAQRFEAEVATLYEQVRNLHAMNQSLAKARDLLLPRLISGQITV